MSAYDAALAEVDLGKLGIAVSKLKFDRPSRFSPTASDFRERVLEPVYHVDAHAMGCACHWLIFYSYANPRDAGVANALTLDTVASKFAKLPKLLGMG